MAIIYIDGKPHETSEGQNLLEACVELGVNVPYFCWHPALGSVGACRQCAVTQYKDENDTQGRVVMSCMTPVADGMRIGVEDQDSKEFRGNVIEWMMTNHPHDCPVCDEGGECHLQDMTLMTGHNYRDYRFQKRTFQNQNLGPFINHEMNRCIQCYRCVRYYKDHAGGTDLDAFANGNRTYFGRHEDGTLESEFSGNLVEVCPTGVFTDKTLKQHYTRRWDLTTAPSVCVHCALGCNITPGERYGKLRRIRNRYNGEVNGYFLCDRGRYGYEYVNSEERPQLPLLRKPDGAGAHEVVDRDVALDYIAPLLRKNARVIGIGSPRATLESNFALRTLVGGERFYLGMSKNDCAIISSIVSVLRDGPVRSPGLGELASYDAVFVLGEDLTNVAPMAALNVRQTVLNRPKSIARKLGIADWNALAVKEAVDTEKGPLYIATPAGGKLDDVATETFHGVPFDIARLGFAVAHAIDNTSPAPQDLSPEVAELAERIARDLLAAEKPLVVSGSTCRSQSIVHAAANIAWALQRKGREPGIYYTEHECNTVGLGLIGGGNLDDAIDTVLSGAADTVVIVENDLYRRADRARVDALFAAAKHVIVLDHTYTETAKKAEVVLPAATFAEGDGTMVNNIGRAQRITEVFAAPGQIRETWRWIRRMRAAAGLGSMNEWTTLDDFLATLVAEVPAFSRIQDVSPSASFRVGGQRIPRQSHRYSGRTAIKANVQVSETKISEDPDSPMSFSMEGFQQMTPAALVSSFWLPGWNSAQSITRFQEEVNGPLEGGDPGIRLIEPREGAIPRYFSDVPASQAATGNAFLVVPLYHIFGSEELSVLSPAVAERTPGPYGALGAADAARLGVNAGDIVEISLGDDLLVLNVQIDPTLGAGIVGLPCGLPGMPYVNLPQTASVRKGNAQ
jgi:NADH-quinone oxidoreductase subunit G